MVLPHCLPVQRKRSSGGITLDFLAFQGILFVLGSTQTDAPTTTIMNQLQQDYESLSDTHQELITAYNDRMNDLEARNEEIRELKAFIQSFVNEGVKRL